MAGEDTRRVARWDVYDVADELADIPGLLSIAIDDPRMIPSIAHDINRMVRRLWDASEIAGTVGPYHNYENER